MTGKKNVAIISCTNETISFTRTKQLAQHLNDHLQDSYTFSIISRNYFGWLSFFYSFFDLVKAVWRNRLIMFIGSPCILALLFTKLISGRKIVVHAENLRWNWLGRPFLKQLTIRIRERVLTRLADLIIVDDPNLQTYLLEQYDLQSKLIPHGTDEVKSLQLEDNTLTVFPFLNEKFALFFVEISPISQVEMVLKAFAQYPKYHLVMVGNWDQGKKSRALKKHFEPYEHIHFLAPQMEPSRLSLLLSKAHIYLHSYEGWGANLSLKEALARQLPAFAFDLTSLNANRPEGVRFYRHTSHLIEQLTRLPKDRKMTQPDSPVANSWQQIAQQFDLAFQACLIGAGQEKPDPSLPLQESTLPVSNSSHMSNNRAGN